ncbi:MAG: JAB-like toxin 1 domain-containing protein, partial [Bacteroidales bacterium]
STGMENRSVSAGVYRFGFQGQEKDNEWTGQQGSHLAFKYRVHDTRIGRFLSVDPMADQRSWVSPYNFVQNSPINRIDPTGALDKGYTYDDDGNVKEIEGQGADDYGGSEYDVLFKKSDFDAGNTAESDGLTVNDTKILSGLSENRTDYNGNYAISSNKRESFNVFYFMANNTNVEWGIDGYRTSGDNEYIIRTSHDDEGVTMSTALSGYNEFNQIFNIHSHPAVDGTKGGSPCTPLGGDMCNIRRRYRRFQNAGMKRTDTWFKKGNQWTVFPKHYVYHKQSKTLYNYTPWKNNVFIRETSKASDMYRNLGF